MAIFCTKKVPKWCPGKRRKVQFFRQPWLVLGVFSWWKLTANRCFPGGVFLLHGCQSNRSFCHASCPTTSRCSEECCSNLRTLCHFMGFNCSNKLRYPSSNQKKDQPGRPGTVTCDSAASSSTRLSFQKISGGMEMTHHFPLNRGVFFCWSVRLIVFFFLYNILVLFYFVRVPNFMFLCI